MNQRRAKTTPASTPGSFAAHGHHHSWVVRIVFGFCTEPVIRGRLRRAVAVLSAGLMVAIGLVVVAPADALTVSEFKMYTHRHHLCAVLVWRSSPALYFFWHDHRPVVGCRA